MSFRITYSTINADMSGVHRSYDRALSEIRSDLAKNNANDASADPNNRGILRNPSLKSEVLGFYESTTLRHLDEIFDRSKLAQVRWAQLSWQERVKKIMAAASYISEHKFRMGVWVSLEAGKNRLEALGEVEEAADLLRYYAKQLEESDGFHKPMLRLHPNEDTRSVLRPYGVFAVIAPFNFPVALGAGMAGAALLGGNSVVLKCSEFTPKSGELLAEAFEAAGIERDLFQLVRGGADIGAAMVEHRHCDGIAFTGSKAVGLKILHAASKSFVKPCLMELGGKNPAIVTASANLSDAVEGCIRSAFGFSGQKCSALSRIYVHESRFSEFVQGLVQRAQKMTVAQATDQDCFVGPVISQNSVERYRRAMATAQKDGEVVWCDESIFSRQDLKEGNFVPPTIVKAPHSSSLMHDELFLPFVAIDTFKTFDEAMIKANDSEYGLTAGIFSQDKSEVDRFFDEVKSGVLYANRKAGATTGAWPGVQPFCGWKGSGSTGKGGCGPYYAMQFMREQSRTRII